MLKETGDETVPRNGVVIVVAAIGAVADDASDGASSEEILTKCLIDSLMTRIRVLTTWNRAVLQRLSRSRVHRRQQRRNVGHQKRGQRAAGVDPFTVSHRVGVVVIHATVVDVAARDATDG